MTRPDAERATGRDAGPAAEPPRHAAERLGVDVRLLELLVCPLGGAPLHLDPETGTLVSRRARLAYPIRDGVPILFPGEAEELSEHDPRLHRPGAPRAGGR